MPNWSEIDEGIKKNSKIKLDTNLVPIMLLIDKENKKSFFRCSFYVYVSFLNAPNETI